MAVTSIQTAVPPRPPSVEITTPRWLAGSLVLVGLLTVAFVICSIVAVREHREALKTIAIDSARSVIAAERMASALSDMDADAANGLLDPEHKSQSLETYNAARDQMTDALVDAAHNITFENEETEIKSLASVSGAYDAKVQSAHSVPNAKSSVALYLEAAAIMDAKLIPGARAVDKINRTELDKSYEHIKQVSILQRILVWITGLLMLAILLRVQFFLTERMRRTLNPLCLLATLLAGILLLYTNHALSTVTHQIDVVKSYAFESVHALWQAKAIAYQANALESRYLLDRANAKTYEDAFNHDATLIASDPEKLAAAAKTSESKPPDALKGFLADELRNITFNGEREAAVKAVDWWSAYIGIDAQIRQLEQSGQHDKAVALCLGTGKDQSNWAFDGFIAALGTTLDINQKEFDKGASLGFLALENFETIATVMALLVVLGCFFGVLPRIREYSA